MKMANSICATLTALTFALLPLVFMSEVGAQGSVMAPPGMPEVLVQLLERDTEDTFDSHSTNYRPSCVLIYGSHPVCGRMGEPVPATFFGEDKMHAGQTLSAYFPRASPPELGFLQRRVAERIPFSPTYYREILAQLHIKTDSEEATDMLSTLRLCDTPPHHGYCVVSYEDMAERAANLLGTPHVRAMASGLPRGGASLQSYTVRAVKPVDGSDFVACHAEAYPYAVFSCHKSTQASVYMLSLVNSYGSGRSIQLLTVCHGNTSAWDKNHVAFDILGSKPGGLPICHVMPYGHLVFGSM